MPKVQRFFLELIKNNKKLKPVTFPKNVKISLDIKKDININKFFYRQVGKDHFWRDRLLWSDNEWKKYIGNKNLETGVMKINEDLVGFYEQEFHKEKNEMELIQNALNRNVERLWVHTCSLDHKYALNNYLSKGLKIFKKEEVNFIP